MKKIHVQLSKKRRDFGAAVKFGDRDANDNFFECRPYRDANFEVNRMQVQTGIQVSLLFSKNRLFRKPAASLLRQGGIGR
jgi:hypothetical protein